MDQNSNAVKWQSRDEMPLPSNPLQELHEILTRTSRDVAQDKMLACIYGIVVGWDDQSYDELKSMHGWNDSNVDRQKQLHSSYQRAWSSFIKDHV